MNTAIRHEIDINQNNYSAYEKSITEIDNGGAADGFSLLHSGASLLKFIIQISVTLINLSILLVTRFFLLSPILDPSLNVYWKSMIALHDAYISPTIVGFFAENQFDNGLTRLMGDPIPLAYTVSFVLLVSSYVTLVTNKGIYSFGDIIDLSSIWSSITISSGCPVVMYNISKDNQSFGDVLATSIGAFYLYGIIILPLFGIWVFFRLLVKFTAWLAN